MRLALGTVQFGLDYGVSNRAGEVPDDELDTILTLARKLGVDTLDTAQAYGKAETRLGSRHTADFQLVGKLAPGIQATEVTTSVAGSLQRLARPRLDGLLLHRSQDASPALFEQLAELQRQGLVGKVGVSVYAPEELARWLAQGYPLELVQLPTNLLDQRFLRSGWLDRLQALGCEIHVRSLFLQGLLLMQPAMRPDYFQAFARPLARLDDWHPHLSPLHKALSLIPALPQVSRFVVGVCHAHELAAIASTYAHLHPGHDDELAALACDEPGLINPAMWRTS
ncbi:aldo/keto reductase [Aeromonas caviae]|uniref:aldo/keto reductase n=1 Tax=Aeromonas TaxID=642 RepID=UPI00085266FB|nr:aldo/keto reductase [Aeromonas caviae]MCR3892857.1 aldo/keto reductase [Aeromonas caviae]MCX4037043.1 aldo/keto reductase [Aeromonas caviae]MDH1995929.1 aldo/keto reductase [Aeromonas caviae]MDX7610609.1 aldo/keto reductase [Aeromonas caviae]MDX7684897.1 aldo/keto reductase [Aeromonas caviae]